MNKKISTNKKLEYQRKYYQKNKEKIRLDQKERWKKYQEDMKEVKLKLGVK